MNWGWRVPFLLSFLLIVAGIFVRNRIPESPEFARAAKSGKMVTIPAREVFNRYFKGFLLTVGLKLPEVTMFYLISVFMLSYGQQLGISKSIMLNSVVAAAAIECVTMYGFGLLGDRYGQKTVAAFGGIFIVFFAYPMFWLVQSGDPLHIFLAILGGLAVGHAVIFGAEPSLTAAQFPVEVRYSGISMGIQLSGAIGGGLAPVVATGLLAYTGTTAYVSLYVAGLGCVATACALMMRSERAPPL